MDKPRLSKIVINKFGEFHGQIKLKNCTLINCVYLSSKEIDQLAMILKYMFSNEDTSIEDFPELKNHSETDYPFVEIHIKTSPDVTSVMRKSYQNDFIFEIDNEKTTERHFKEKLHEYGFLFTFTWFIKQQTIDKLMKCNNIQRVDLIECICGNTELRSRYNLLKTKMETLELQMKMLHDHKKEFIMEKNMEKLRVENSKKIKEAVNEYEKNLTQLTLLKLYNNENRAIAAISQKDTMKKEWDESRRSCHDWFDELIACVNRNILKRMEVGISENQVIEINESLINCKKIIKNAEIEIESLPQQKVYQEMLKEVHDINDKSLKEAVMKLSTLEKHYKKYKNTMQKFKEFEKKLLLEHPDYKLYQVAKTQVQGMENFKKIIEIYESQLDLLETAEPTYENQIAILVDKENTMHRKLGPISAKIHRLRPEIDEAYKIIKENEKAINTHYEKVMDVTEYTKMFELKLKMKFPNAIVGILSELFDVKEVNGITVTKPQILSLLGSYSNAIVLENATMEQEVRNYAQAHTCEPHKKIILICQRKAAPKGIMNLQQRAPKNVKIAAIEDFVVAASVKIKNTLSRLLQQTVVCDSGTFEDVAETFDIFCQEVRVVSFASGIAFNANGSITKLTSIATELNVVELTDEMIKMKEKRNALHAKLETAVHEMKLYLDRLKNLQVIKKLLTEMKNNNLKFKELLKAKIGKFKEFTAREGDQNFIKIRTTCEKYSEKFRPMLEKYKSNLPIDTVEILKYYDLMHKCHAEAINTLKSTKENLSKFIENLDCDWNLKEEEIKATIQNFQSLEMELEEKLIMAEVERNDRNAEWKCCIERLVKARSAHYDSKCKSLISLLNFLTTTYEPKHVMAENHQILSNILMECETIPLSSGSLLNMINLPNCPISPDDVDENFDLIWELLSGIRPNFNVLNDDLKAPDEINKNIRDMEESMERLTNDLANFPLDFGYDENELASINEKISGLALEIRNTNAETQSTLGALRSITEERSRRFSECIEIINREIEKYCLVVSNGKFIGELVPVNEQEPYLGSLQYTWLHGRRSEYVNENHKNWHAALAFMLGILSYKKQNLLAYFEISSKYPMVYALHAYCANKEANMQSIVFWQSDTQEALCHNTILRYNNKLNIDDNQDVEELLKEDE